ncbi:MAG: M28 family peptidase, partial [Rhodospirillaceae bacterium]|nr:M28 family peptidase [Rhodospirillaceae bacterium]
MVASLIEFALQNHISVLCDDIGSRSGAEPESLGRARDYISQTLREMGYDVTLQSYDYVSPAHARSLTAANVIARPGGAKRKAGGRGDILIGAHYDTVAGTVGADDNASAV